MKYGGYLILMFLAMEPNTQNASFRLEATAEVF